MRTKDCFGQPVEEINWQDNLAKETLDKTLDEMLENKDLQISITHIVSNDFTRLYDVNEPDDFNGWQCSWWSRMYYKGIRLSICGNAFYGTIDISHPED